MPSSCRGSGFFHAEIFEEIEKIQLENIDRKKWGGV